MWKVSSKEKTWTVKGRCSRSSGNKYPRLGTLARLHYSKPLGSTFVAGKMLLHQSREEESGNRPYHSNFDFLSQPSFAPFSPSCHQHVATSTILECDEFDTSTVNSAFNRWVNF
ncbi:hypothetical protein ACSQ67_006232 [Phaseolus vulgaris]